jgi:hypothetical protein
MIYNTYVQEEKNIKEVPKELIETAEVIAEKPIDGNYEKYREKFSFHKVSNELSEWLQHEFRTTLLPEKGKYYYWCMKDMPLFTDAVKEEVFFYAVDFDNQFRFWSQWFENERVEQTRIVEDTEAELCKFKFKPEPGKWYRLKLDEIHELETKTPVCGIICYD